VKDLFLVACCFGTWFFDGAPGWAFWLFVALTWPALLVLAIVLAAFVAVALVVGGLKKDGWPRS
jgi:hypothetical protein